MTKAAPHFLGHAGWQNSTTTHFPEQKTIFSVLHRLGHPGSSKVSFIWSQKTVLPVFTDSHIILLKRFRALWGSEKIMSFSGLLRGRTGCLSPVGSTLLQLQGLEKERPATKQEGTEGPQQLTALEPCLCSRDRVCYWQAGHSPRLRVIWCRKR